MRPHFIILSFLCWITLALQGLAIEETNSLTQPLEPTQPIVKLRQNVQVNSTGTFLHDLVEGECGASQAVRLASAPSLGQSLELSRAQISELVRKQAPSLNLTNWGGAEKVKISRRLRALEENELREMLTSTLQREKVRDRGELELRLGRPWAPITVPDEPLVLKLQELPVSGVTPNFIVRFEIRTEAEIVGNWQIPLQARIWRDIWVARSPQPRGRLLADLDLTTERRDILTLRDALTNLNFNEAALELTENLAPGAPLVARSLRVRPIIQRGRVVDVIIQDGALLISLKAEALEDGLPGQTIRVRNANSRREFRGKVQNEQTIIVTL